MCRTRLDSTAITKYKTTPSIPPLCGKPVFLGANRAITASSCWLVLHFTASSVGQKKAAVDVVSCVSPFTLGLPRCKGSRRDPLQAEVGRDRCRVQAAPRQALTSSSRLLLHVELSQGGRSARGLSTLNTRWYTGSATAVLTNSGQAQIDASRFVSVVAVSEGRRYLSMLPSLELRSHTLVFFSAQTPRVVVCLTRSRWLSVALSVFMVLPTLLPAPFSTAWANRRRRRRRIGLTRSVRRGAGIERGLHQAEPQVIPCLAPPQVGAGERARCSRRKVTFQFHERVRFGRSSEST